MAETFERSSTVLSDTNSADIYVAPSDNATDRVVILSCIVATTGSAAAEASIDVKNSSDQKLSSIGARVNIPLGSPVEFIKNKLVLKPGEKLSAFLFNPGATGIDCTVSVLEITA